MVTSCLTLWLLPLMPLFILKIEMSLFGGSMKDGGSLFSVATSASTSLSALTKDQKIKEIFLNGHIADEEEEPGV